MSLKPLADMGRYFLRWLKREGMDGFDGTAKAHAWRAFRAGVRYGRRNRR